MNTLLKTSLVLLILAGFTATQNDNNKSLSVSDIFKIVAGMMQNINSSTNNDFQTTITKMLKNDTFIKEVLKKIPFQGKTPSPEMIRQVLKNFNGIGSLSQLIGGGIDPMKFLSSALVSLNISLACLGDLSNLVKPFINKTFNPLLFAQSPLATMLDSWGKPPSRIFIGNLQWIGAIDECESKSDFHYCKSPFVFLQNPRPEGRGKYGTCFPKSCRASDVDQMLSTIQGSLQGIITFSSGTTCNVSPKYSTGAIITITLFSLIILISLLGTITEYLQDAFTPSGEFIPNAKTHENDIVISNENKKEDFVDSKNGVIKLETAPDVKITRGNTLTNVLICFSIPRNIKALLSTKSPKGAIDCINGIRFISMTWVILGHYYFIPVITNNTDNVLTILNELRKFAFMPISNAYVSVDSFFLLSGLLVSYLTLRRIDAKGGMTIGEYCIYLLHRYLRLTPSLIVLILFYTNILPLILSGPFSIEIRNNAELIQRSCLDYWWTDILYINNFYPETMGAQCVGWVWYLANDMQFYIVSPAILLLFYYFDEKFEFSKLRYVGAFIITGLLCTSSFVITASLIGENDYPRLISSLVIPGNPRAVRAGPAQDAIYEKPYTRIPAYLVGLLLGYILSRKLSFKPRYARMCNFIGWSGAITVALAIIYGPWHVFRTENQSFMTDAENIFYGTFHRFAWSVAVAWVIYSCHNKMGGWVNSFLSWKLFLPLGRMSYGAYLMHFVVLDYYVLCTETPFHLQQNLMAFPFLGAVVLSYACAFILSILIELPVANLEKMIF